MSLEVELIGEDALLPEHRIVDFPVRDALAPEHFPEGLAVGGVGPVFVGVPPLPGRNNFV